MTPTGEQRQTRQLAYCIKLLQLWQADARSYLVYKMASEHFTGLPEKDRHDAKRMFMERLYAPLQAITECEDDSIDHMLAIMVGCCGLYYYADASTLDAERIARLAVQAYTKES